MEKLAGYGLTYNAIAHILGLASRTFRDKKATDARVSAALEKGRAVAERKVGEAVFRRALKGDMTAAIWWEKTRAGRTDRQIHRIETDEGTGVLVVPSLGLDRDAWAALAGPHQARVGGGADADGA